MFHAELLDKIKRRVLISITFFFSKIVPFYGITWRNTVVSDRPQLTIWRMRIAWWIPKAKNTPSEYVLLTAFPLQRWLHERVSMLRYTYIACHVITQTMCVYCAVRFKSLNMSRVTVVFKCLTSILVLSPFTPDPWHCFSSRFLRIFTIKRKCYRSLRSRVSERSVLPLNACRKKDKNVVTSKGIQVGIVCK